MFNVFLTLHPLPVSTSPCELPSAPTKRPWCIISNLGSTETSRPFFPRLQGPPLISGMLASPHPQQTPRTSEDFSAAIPADSCRIDEFIAAMSCVLACHSVDELQVFLRFIRRQGLDLTRPTDQRRPPARQLHLQHLQQFLASALATLGNRNAVGKLRENCR